MASESGTKTGVGYATPRAKDTKAVQRAQDFFAERFGEPLMEKGFVGVPITLVRMQATLGLEPLDFCIVVHLLSFWSPKSLPFPSQKVLAKAIGVHIRTLRRRLRAMKASHLITMNKVRTKSGRLRNEYDLGPLFGRAGGIVLWGRKEAEKAESKAAKELAMLLATENAAKEAELKAALRGKKEGQP